MANILVVDDEQGIREVMRAALEVEGYRVTTAANGEEALEKMRRRKFDAVLLDIMMPGKSGYEVLQEIRGIPKRADTPVVVVTAKHDPAGLAREVHWGAVDHLVKPFHSEELLDAVARAVNGSSAALEERRRILGSDADVYGSIQDLYASVHAAEGAH